MMKNRISRKRMVPEAKRNYFFAAMKAVKKKIKQKVLRRKRFLRSL